MPKVFHTIKDFFWPADKCLRRDRLWLAISGLILAAAWPPLPLGFLAFFALIIPLDILSRRTFGGAFKGGFFFAYVYHLATLYWIVWVTIPGTFAGCAIISLYNGFVFGLFAGLYRRNKILALILMPFLWVGLEYFRTQTEIAFPWANLSYTQHAYLPFLQFIEYTGDAGLSFIIVVVNILLWRIWRTKKRRAQVAMAVTVGLLTVLPTIYGISVLKGANNPERHEYGPVIKIALLQGDVDLTTKWDPAMLGWNLDLYDSLAGQAGEVDLIVWPETAAPEYLLSRHTLTAKVAATARKAHTPMLVGMLDTDISDDKLTIEYFNAAVQFDADGNYRIPYHKMMLVPYAETVPYRELTPWLQETPLGWSDFAHGDKPQIYSNRFGSYGILICYEILFPELINDYIQNGADFLVNITNDTWWGHSSAPYQHGVMAVFRAIENRVYIARAANSGFSYFVDDFGRIINKSRFLERTIVRGEVYPLTGRTVFNRTGPFLGRLGLLLIGIVSLILPLIVLWEKRR